MNEDRPSMAADYQQYLLRKAHHEIANERFPAKEQEQEQEEEEHDN